jgi:hypothetical protein
MDKGVIKNSGYAFFQKRMGNESVVIEHKKKSLSISHKRILYPNSLKWQNHLIHNSEKEFAFKFSKKYPWKREIFHYDSEDSLIYFSFAFDEETELGVIQ